MLKYNCSYSLYQNKLKNKKILSLKNFFYFFLFLKYMSLSRYSINYSFFFKKNTKLFKNILNSPNRHKISQTKLLFNSYYFIIKINLFFNKIYLKNNLFSFFFYNYLFFSSFLSFFESYLITLNSKKYFLNFKLNYNNLLK